MRPGVAQSRGMAKVTRLPARREVFVDARGDSRTMQVTAHPEHGLVVVSLWQGGSCTASFRLPLADSARLVAALAAALGDAASTPSRRAADSISG